jgi:hypothetical protein
MRWARALGGVCAATMVMGKVGLADEFVSSLERRFGKRTTESLTMREFVGR